MRRSAVLILLAPVVLMSGCVPVGREPTQDQRAAVGVWERWSVLSLKGSPDVRKFQTDYLNRSGRRWRVPPKHLAPGAPQAVHVAISDHGHTAVLDPGDVSYTAIDRPNSYWAFRMEKHHGTWLVADFAPAKGPRDKSWIPILDGK